MAKENQTGCPIVDEDGIECIVKMQTEYIKQLEQQLLAEKQKVAALRIDVSDIVRVLRCEFIGNLSFVQEPQRTHMMGHVREQIKGTFEWDEESYEDLLRQCSYHMLDSIEWGSHFEDISQETVITEYYTEPEVLEVVKYIMQIHFQCHPANETILDCALSRVSRWSQS